MLKRWICLLLALMGLATPALAEVYAGVTAALETVPICAEAAGTMAAVEAEVGQRVEAGQALAALKSEKVFAGQDGMVSLVEASAGEDVDGTVLEIALVERYTIHCTVDKAYQSAASTLLHSGETVYIKCTADGTHRAVGVVTQIDGSEYRVLTLGGELYVGEAVYLYRDGDFTASLRVGAGTVVASDTQVYEASGALSRLCVAAGDVVERGQLLYELGGGSVEAACAGILADISCQPGESVAKGQVVAGIVPEDAVGVEIEVDEAQVSRIAVGDAASLTFAGQEDECALPGTVVEILDAETLGTYIVRIKPEAGAQLPLGMSVEARF